MILQWLLAIACACSAGAAAARERARHLESVPIAPVGGLTGEFLNLAPTSMGPAAPVFEADVEPLTDVFASSPAALESKIVPPMVRIMEQAGCSIGAAVPSCAGNLSICLSVDITSQPAACACYKNFATCFSAAGCIELLPDADVTYCRNKLFCSRSDFDLSAAGAYFVSLFAVAALVVGAGFAAVDL
jgi:hypothetical protein